MYRTAIFVDAGYLFAQGSAALTGSSKSRDSLVLDAPAAIAELRNVLSARCPGCSLLRVYWYDGSLGLGRLSADQALLAGLDDVKLRLGLINSFGQQKGVDSLIVTDLIELARLQSICDAILLSGDEDVRVGVQIAQSYGVRVHLLGIVPSRGSQSAHLLMEADTTTEWDRQIVGRFLAERLEPQAGGGLAANFAVGTDAQETNDSTADQDVAPILEATAKNIMDALQASEIEGLAAYWGSGARGLPPELDRRLLPSARKALNRDLDGAEKRAIRGHFQQLARQRISAAASLDS